jgi:pyridinium-3,5-bisthiocarboxylic acid mononucleotide nickel chelatase
MKVLYLDLFSGISGDMFIGALLDLGVDPGQLEHELRKLGLGGYHLHVSRAHKASIEGVKFDVHLEHDHHHHDSHSHTADHQHEHEHEHQHDHGHSHSHSHPHTHEEQRTFPQIRQMIEGSPLSEWVKQKSVAVFRHIAAGEGKIHGLPPDQVHFHEVGAVDSIVDIVGGCIALELLGKPRLLASPVIEGTGWVDCAHGRFPIPAPATLAILGARGIALSQCDEPHELVTPTGAALLAELVEHFGPMRALIAEKVGFGLGTRDNRTRPNVLRAVYGKTSGEESEVGSHDWEADTVAVLETNLDDINAEILGQLMEKALAAGALDVFHTAIQMKKSRPGVLLTVLCAESDADKFSELLLRETSAFGVRRSLAERRKLRREFISVPTPHGPVAVKIGKLDGRVLQAAPEYEACRKLAEQAGIPLKEVYAAALRAIPESLLA